MWLWLNLVFGSRAEAVDNGDDEPPNTVFRSAIRSDAHRIETPVHADDLPIYGHKVFQYVLRVTDDILFRKAVREYLMGRPTS